MIISGGLGPTEDDVTRDAVAQALDRKLVFHREIARAAGAAFRAVSRKMAEINRRQAFIIEGAEILPNDRGTAPGQWIDESGAVGHAAARSAARTEGDVRAAVPAAARRQRARNR